jgi:hypothetical protein
MIIFITSKWLKNERFINNLASISGMKSKLIYFEAGLPESTYDIRRAFEIDDSVLHEELPKKQAFRDIYDPCRTSEQIAKERLTELGFQPYDCINRGFFFNAKKIAEYSREIPYRKELDSFLTESRLRRDIYKTNSNGVYIIDDHMKKLPRAIESYIHEMCYARIISELSDVKESDLEGILTKLKKVDGVPFLPSKE